MIDLAQPILGSKIVYKTDEFFAKANRIINPNMLRNIMYLKISKDPKITVSLKSDKDANMRLISELHTELRKAQALKLSYSALTKENQ